MQLNHKVQLILVSFVSIVGTVLILDAQGYVNHSSEKDALYVAEFSLIANVSGAESVVSSKPSDFVARCTQGYLVMDAIEKVSKSLSGVVVDKKKRAVPCLP